LIVELEDRIDTIAKVVAQEEELGSQNEEDPDRQEQQDNCGGCKVKSGRLLR
jgi:hypothetical protein